MSIDLHIHSVYSDGTYTPAELVGLAQQRGIQAISITDHDTIDGLAEAAEAAQGTGITTLAGIELSVQHKNRNLHILGYLFDSQNERFRRQIHILQETRNARNRDIVKKLNSCGISLDIEEIESISKTGQTGRPHIARALCRRGVVKNFDEAFTRYLKKGAAAYASRFVYNAAEALEMIRENGGISVLAHPLQVDPSPLEIARVVGELVEYGLDGLELYYPTHSAKVRRNLKKIAKRYDLVLTGGSDYHGTIRPGTELAGGKNVYVPAEIVDTMVERQAKLAQRPRPGDAAPLFLEK